MKTKSIEIGIIILAAGASSRLGTSKQLLRIDGEPLLIRTIHAALATLSKHVVVVLGSEAELHQKAINHFPLQPVINNNWIKGMGNSIKCGLHHLLHIHEFIDAVMICVCDQPLITSRHLNSLIAKFTDTGATIVASRYAGVNGVPVLFSREHFEKITGLDDKSGAKQILLQNPDLISHVDFPNGIYDIDTSQDIDDFLKNRI
jgi:molybdenum cofactor cytidylyltransferase